MRLPEDRTLGNPRLGDSRGARASGARVQLSPASRERDVGPRRMRAREDQPAGVPAGKEGSFAPWPRGLRTQPRRGGGGAGDTREAQTPRPSPGGLLAGARRPRPRSRTRGAWVPVSAPARCCWARRFSSVCGGSRAPRGRAPFSVPRGSDGTGFSAVSPAGGGWPLRSPSVDRGARAPAGDGARSATRGVTLAGHARGDLGLPGRPRRGTGFDCGARAATPDRRAGPRL